MSFIDKLLGNATAAPIDAIGGVLDKLFTSDEERLQAQAVMEKLRQHPAELQAEINKIEAAHRSVFVAGWRPALGWVSAIALAMVFVVNPSLQWITGAPGPEMPLELLMDLVWAMLGVASWRSVEKLKGRTK